MNLPSARKMPKPFIAALSLVALLGLSDSCRAAVSDRATRAADVFNSFCLSTSPNFSDTDRRATAAHYKVLIDRTIPMPHGETLRQKNWLITSSGGAPTMLTTESGVNGMFYIFGCGIFAPDIAHASMERALSLLPRLGSPTKRTELPEGSSFVWWSARFGKVLPSDSSQVMLAPDTPGMPGSTVSLMLRTQLGH
jgi:hypothetical protein